MTILYCGSFRFPTGDAAAARVLGNAKIMRDLGHTVEFLAFGGKQEASNYQGFEYAISGDLDMNKKSVGKIRSLLTMGYKAYEEIKRKISKYDLIIVYNTAGWFTYKLRKLCNKHGVKLALDSTEWYSHRDYRFGYFNPFYWLYELSERFVQTRIKNILPISKYLSEHYSSSSNQLILPPLVDLNEEKWKKPAPEILSSNGKTFIYAGNAGNKKDRIDIVLDALEELVNRNTMLKMVVLGGEIRYRNDRQRAKLQNSVQVLGRVSQTDVPSYYKLADFSILIRDVNRKSNAGFSTKLAESIAAGVPPIINITSNIIDYLSDNKNAILLNSPNKDELVERLLEVCDMTESHIKEMSEEVNQTARRSFHYESYMSAMRMFLKQLE